MTARSVFQILLLGAIILIFPACDEDDIPNIPEIPEFEDPVLEALVQEGAVLTQGLVAVFPEIATGDFLPKDVVDPYYDESCNCWRWSSFEEHYVGPEESWHRGWNFAATLFQEGTPQMEFAGTDSVSLQIGFSYSENKYTDEDNFVSKYLYANILAAITNMASGVLDIEGSGPGSFQFYKAVDGEYDEVYKEFMATLDLTYPVFGCPTGTLLLDADPATFTVSADGTNKALWEYQLGPGDPKTGSFPIPCGN